ncbi:unnamed protein product, partial [Polarella glacialis]
LAKAAPLSRGKSSSFACLAALSAHCPNEHGVCTVHYCLVPLHGPQGNLNRSCFLVLQPCPGSTSCTAVDLQLASLQPHKLSIRHIN